MELIRRDYAANGGWEVRAMFLFETRVVCFLFDPRVWEELIRRDYAANGGWQMRARLCGVRGRGRGVHTIVHVCVQLCVRPSPCCLALLSFLP